MRTCPKCGRQFTDDLSYCLEDGSRLSGQPTDGLAGSPTAQYGPVTAGRDDISTLKTLESGPGAFGNPAPKQYRLAAVEPTSRMGCIVTVGQVGLGLILVAGLGLAGFYYVNNKAGVDVALNEPKASNSNTPSLMPSGPSSNSAGVSNTANRPAANIPTTKQPSGPVSIPSDVPATSTGPTPDATPGISKGLKPPKTISGGVLNGKAIDLPKPPYPPAARAVRASGAVTVQVLVDERGNVVSASALSGHPLLRSAAVNAARSARFSPTILAGQPVKVSGVITYNFVP